MTEIRLTNPAHERTNPCPDCSAKAGEKCSRPTSTGRADVSWEHRARVDARYMAADTVSLFAPMASDTAAIVAKQMLQEEDRQTEEKLIEVLRLRGWMVERAPSGDSVSGLPVARFRTAWHAADAAGRAGNRVRAGLEAARSALNLEALRIIDKTIDNAELPGNWGPHEVVAMLRGIREALDPSGPVSCRCKSVSEPRGGGYFELMLEPEPTCAEHGGDDHPGSEDALGQS